MKKLITVIILFFVVTAHSQTFIDEKIQIETIFNAETMADSIWYEKRRYGVSKRVDLIDFPDVQPQFEGRYNSFESVFTKELQPISKKLRKNLRKKGKAVLAISFNINDEAVISDIHIIDGFSDDIEKEIIAIIKNGKWDAGEHKGMRAPYKCSLRIIFSERK